eukprot:CAMPEP_0114534210 /NCGR_PEP_ID=MMETSP0109-20121206/27715_1 /TAXON_ID=29199 /ORGANISM="Chlorarachnion reptans, Strain CCCM449" /LENGTH=274 /DNA_ID=CAMNT_0001717601 /DNA_START=269 /DNA_END=1089 /DNA_ORIENTATION=+
MLHDQPGPFEVRHTRPHFWIVHRVCEIPHDDHVESLAQQLPDPKRPSQHAHVQVHPDEYDILDALVGQYVVHELALVRDEIAPFDGDPRVLPRPRLAACALPTRTAAPAVAVIDRQRRLGLLVGPAPGVAPPRLRRERLGGVGVGEAPGVLQRVRAAVERGDAARAVDDRAPPGPPRGGDARDRPRELADPGRRGPAPVGVPHVADHDRRPLRVPAAPGLRGRPGLAVAPAGHEEELRARRAAAAAAAAAAAVVLVLLRVGPGRRGGRLEGLLP